jgi:uncharacterized damage-inducible protein DinB
LATSFVSSIVSEYRRYKALGDSAIQQLADDQLTIQAPARGNSIATLVWHLGGNLRSRFTDFLTSDGEKPWRRRDEEFEPRQVTRAELLAKWNGGWDALFSALETVTDDRLGDVVTIRGQAFEVHDALHRSLAHVSYHVGQMVMLAKSIRGDAWTCLSIPLGRSEEYNRNPANQDAAAHAAAVATKTK